MRDTALNEGIAMGFRTMLLTGVIVLVESVSLVWGK